MSWLSPLVGCGPVATSAKQALVRYLSLELSVFRQTWLAIANLEMKNGLEPECEDHRRKSNCDGRRDFDQARDRRRNLRVRRGALPQTKRHSAEAGPGRP